MQKQVGTFAVEECFRLSSRGWVLVGTLTGQVVQGNQLIFASGTALPISAVESLKTRGGEKDVLVGQNQVLGQDDRVEKQIVGLTAHILA